MLVQGSAHKIKFSTTIPNLTVPKLLKGPYSNATNYVKAQIIII